jgi:hypothetical protein
MPVISVKAVSSTIALILFSSIATAQQVPTSGTAERNALVLAPNLVFEKLQDESPLDPARFGGATLEKQLSEAGGQYLRSKGFSILAAANYSTETARLIGKLQPMAGRIARGSMTADAGAVLADAANGLGKAFILAQYMRVRVGSKGSWNPISGAITSGQVETMLAAALIDPAEGAIVWKNEILVRKVLLPDSKNLAEALSALYETLK